MIILLVLRELGDSLWLCVVAVHTPKRHASLGLELGVIAVSTFLFISGCLMPLACESSSLLSG